MTYIKLYAMSLIVRPFVSSEKKMIGYAIPPIVKKVRKCDFFESYPRFRKRHTGDKDEVEELGEEEWIFPGDLTPEAKVDDNLKSHQNEENEADNKADL